MLNIIYCHAETIFDYRHANFWLSSTIKIPFIFLHCPSLFCHDNMIFPFFVLCLVTMMNHNDKDMFVTVITMTKTCLWFSHSHLHRMYIIFLPFLFAPLSLFSPMPSMWHMSMGMMMEGSHSIWTMQVHYRGYVSKRNLSGEVWEGEVVVSVIIDARGGGLMEEGACDVGENHLGSDQYSSAKNVNWVLKIENKTSVIYSLTTRPNLKLK